MPARSRNRMNDFLAGKNDTAAQDEAAEVRDLCGLIDDVKDGFKKRDDLYGYIDDILFRRITPQIPPAYAKTALVVHSPLAQHVANMVTAALSINPPKTSFQPVGFGRSFEENATQREHFFDASWMRQEEEAKQPLFRKFMYSIVTKGEGILKTVERSKTAWSEYTKLTKQLRSDLDAPEGPYQDIKGDQAGKDAVFNAKTEEFKRAAAYPIKTVYVPASSFYYRKGDDGFNLCLEVKDVDYIEGLEKFGYELDTKGKVVPQGMGMAKTEWTQIMGKAKSIRLGEVWTWKTVYYLMVGPGQEAAGSSAVGGFGNATLVKKLDHGYGDPTTRTLRGPYFHALGTTTDSSLPECAGLSMLYPYLDLFPLIDSLLTIRSNAAYMTGFPAFKRKAPAGAVVPAGPFGQDNAEKDSATTQIIPGGIYPYDIEPIQQPGAGPEFSNMLQELRTMTESALPAVAQGGGGESGYDTNQRQYTATLIWSPPLDNAERALAERTSFESWLIENKIKEKVYVWGTLPPDQQRHQSKDNWLSMGPDELKGNHRYKITLNPETPSNRVIEIRTHTELLSARLEAPEDAITELGGNPDEVERAWLMYDLKQDPHIKQALTDRVFQELKTIDATALGGVTPQVQMPPIGVPGALGQVGTAQAPIQGGLSSGEGATQGQVFQPGQNGQPLFPRPPGAAPGTPEVPNAPANALPLPGQGPR